MTIKEVITAKLTSGKFIFTIISALVFAVMALKGLLPQDKVMEVILIVIYAYFTRKGETSETPPKP
jgi:hypothetical protein